MSIVISGPISFSGYLTFSEGSTSNIKIYLTFNNTVTLSSIR